VSNYTKTSNKWHKRVRIPCTIKKNMAK